MVVNLFSDDQLRKLKRDLDHSNKAAYADGTRKNLRVQWESYLLFCAHFNFVSIPTNTSTLQLYSQFLSRTFKSTDSIRNYIVGVKTMHLLLGYSVDNINKFILNLSLKGIAKLHPYCRKQAEPITPEILISIADSLNLSVTNNLVYWCLFLFAFFLMARKSNLVPTTGKDLLEKKFLLRQDISDKGDHLIVKFRWTKTIQKGERILEIPLIQIPDSILCPVKAYRSMCKAIPAVADSPLFVLSNNKAVNYRLFQSKLKQCIHNIGLDSANFTSHGFRRGFATLLFKAKTPADKIQLMGDWHSDAYKKYLAFTLEDKIKVAENMRCFIVKSSVGSS